MSIAAMTWAWSMTHLEAGKTLLLLRLADHANEDGMCWPSVENLAEAARVSQRTVARYLNELAADGLIEKISRRGSSGRRERNLYVLKMAVSPPDKLAGGETENPDPPPDKNPPHHLTTVSGNKANALSTPKNHQRAQARASLLPEPVELIAGRFSIDDAVFDQWIQTWLMGRSRVDTEAWIEFELGKAETWLLANPARRKRNWMRFLNNWLARASDGLGGQRQRFAKSVAGAPA